VKKLTREPEKRKKKTQRDKPFNQITAEKGENPKPREDWVKKEGVGLQRNAQVSPWEENSKRAPACMEKREQCNRNSGKDGGKKAEEGNINQHSPKRLLRRELLSLSQAL